MTQVPALRDALRDAADRRYSRRRARFPFRGRARRPSRPATASPLTTPPQLTAASRSGGVRRRSAPARAMIVVLAGVAALIAVWGLTREARRATEVVATPTPTVATPYTLRTEPVPVPTPTGPLTLVRPTLLDGAAVDAAVAADGGPGVSGTLERAWKTPGMHGHIFLVRKGTDWCLSVPDPAGESPGDRGVGCSNDRVFARYGVSVRVGDSYAAVIGPGRAAPTFRRPNGAKQPLDPAAGGLVAIAGLRSGSAVTLHGPGDASRTDGYREQPRTRFFCSDGSMLDGPDAPLPSDPCSELARRNRPRPPLATPARLRDGRGD